MAIFSEYIVYTGKTAFKTFTHKDKAIQYAKKHDKEVWEDTCTTGGLIIDTCKVYPDTTNNREKQS